MDKDTTTQDKLIDRARKAVRRYADGVRDPVDRNRQMAYEDGLVNWILGEVAKVEKVVDALIRYRGLSHKQELNKHKPDEVEGESLECVDDCPRCDAEIELFKLTEDYQARKKGKTT